jgi:hypothetical protein
MGTVNSGCVIGGFCALIADAEESILCDRVEPRKGRLIQRADAEVEDMVDIFVDSRLKWVLPP